jgi:lipopolysaccharide transport system ATP-binding protein
MSSDIVIKADGLGKAYTIFKRPEDRLKQMLSFGRRRYFEHYWALQDVNLEVRKGQAIALIGHNGAGKSTFLKLLCGTVTPTTGSIQVAGRIGALLELGAGFNPEFTGRENLRLSASVMGFSTEEIVQKEPAIIEFADIGDFLDQPVKLYSSGMYARLAFAVMAHMDPDILIVDEILSVGDAAFQQKCMRFIRKFRQNGTLMFVSHDSAAVLNLCEHAIWLDAGTVRMAGSAKDVCHAYQAAIESGKINQNAFHIGGTRKAPDAVIDETEQLLRQSGEAPKVKVFSFDADAPWYGHGGATIQTVSLLDSDRRPLDLLTGGDDVILRVEAVAKKDLDGPIIGFYVKDRLGQNLFGNNTYLAHAQRKPQAQEGATVAAEFRFRLPFMPSGNYAITVALAEGTQEEHVHHHWIDDALLFKVANPNEIQGLLGVPMTSIDLDVGK